jgi:hypothetical protein
MKALIHSRLLLFLPGVCVLSLPCATSAQRLAANPVPADITYGSMTNGVRGGVDVRPGVKGGPAITVFVTNSNPGELIRLETGISFLTNFLQKIKSPDWLYYMATNEFCGLLELRDPNGKKLPLLRPEVSRTDAYPARYSLSAENANYLRRFQVYSGSGIFPVPLLGIQSCSELAKFNVVEYFELKEAGEYRLTVRPKIYKRMSKTNDVCERIDVPPVIVTIRWAGQSASPPPHN